MDTNNDQEQLNLVTNLIKTGDALKASGDLFGAKQHYEQFLEIMRMLTENIQFTPCGCYSFPRL